MAGKHENQPQAQSDDGDMVSWIGHKPNSFFRVVSASGCLRANVTCSAEYLLFFINICSFLRYLTIPKNSHYGWPSFRGADQL